MRHRTEVARVVRVFARGSQRSVRPDMFAAKCDCGWEGRAMDTKRDADDDADEHVRMMADES